VIARSDGVLTTTPYELVGSEFGFDSKEALVESLSEELHGFDVELRFPPGAGLGPDFCIEAARWLVAYVPWDSLQDAVAQVLVTSLGGWLVRQVRKRKQQDKESGDRLRDRIDDLFPEGASREEKETLLRETHYRVAINQDKRGSTGPIAIIEVDEPTEEVRITNEAQM
jgi:hypothetical protein